MTTEETIVINKMIEQTPDVINQNREYYPRWIVQLVHGTPGQSGVITEQEYVTKKWERVESIMDAYILKSSQLPQHEHGEWYVTVQEVACVSIGDYTMNFIQQKKDTNA